MSGEGAPRLESSLLGDRYRSMDVPYSVTGRCTSSAYPVYEKATGNLKYYVLKDLWRAYGLNPEVGILREIREQQVDHIPKFLCGGEIDDKTTVTDLYIPEQKNSPADRAVPPLKAPWAQAKDWLRITRRIHHRFVVYSIEKPLSDFENSKQLMQVVFDGFTASQQAYEKCEIIHRDISVRNILIDQNGRGVLNDWDLAKHEDKLEQLRNHERTGTWQFMSCLLLSRHHYIHTIQDDMESFIYVMFYCGLRYLQHNYTKNLRNLLKRIFDDEDVDGHGLVIGGMEKRILSGAYLGTGFEFSCQPFDAWCTWSFEAVDEWIKHCNPRPATKNKGTLSVWRVRAEPTQGPVPKPYLYDHSSMAHAFIECLNSEDWPTDERRPIDAAPDAGGVTKVSKCLAGY